MARTDTLGNFLTDVADAIRTKKGSEELIAAEDFDTEIENLPSGSRTEAPDKDVNFYDYDGFRVYSYSASEFLALEEMPANPEHDGLTAQGWNWPFDKAQEYVEDYGILDVGQNYITTDEKTKIYVEMREYLSPTMVINTTTTDTIEINWGDGTATEQYIPTYTNGSVTVTHTYSQNGDYIININPLENTCYITGNSNVSNLFRSDDGTAVKSYKYATCIKKIEIGKSFELKSYALSGLKNLQSITMPTSHTTLDTYMFNSTSNLKCVVIPKNTSSIPGRTFQNAYLNVLPLPYGPTSTGDVTFTESNLIQRLTLPSTITTVQGVGKLNYLKTVILPTSITTFMMYAVANSPSLKSLKIPNTVTNIPLYCFYNNPGCQYYDFSSFINIPTLANTNAFGGISTDCKIIVPDSLYEDWITANNWSTYADYIISKSDWDALQNT